MHPTSPEHPLDAVASFATRLIPSRAENPAQMAPKLARPFVGAPNPLAISAHGCVPGQGCASGAPAPVQPGTTTPAQGAPTFASPPSGASSPPAATKHGRTPDQEYGSGAGPQVQPQGYGLGFTGSTNTQAPQTPGDRTTACPYNGQNFEPPGTQHPIQPAPPVNKPQVQAPTEPFRPSGKTFTRADCDEVHRRMNDSPEIQYVTPLMPSHTTGAPTAPVNQSTTKAPLGFGQADADTVAKALREARETVGQVDSDALFDMMRERQKKRLAAGEEAGPATAAPSVAKTVEATEPET